MRCGFSKGASGKVYAIFQFQGMQYKAESGAVIRLPLDAGAVGSTLTISDVLLVNDGTSAHIGTPFISGASVSAEILKTGRDEKVISYKYKRRTKYRRTIGHRQDFTDIKVQRIVTP